MANYPTSAPSFSNKSAGQSIASAHINAIQDEVVAIGAGLLQGTAPLASSNSTVAALSVAGNSTLGAAVVIPNSTTATLGAGNTNDLALPSSVFWLITTANAAGSTLTSMTAGTNGRMVGIMNIGAGNPLVLASDTAALGTAANRFATGSTISAGGVLLVVYQSNRWRPIGRSS